MKRIATVGAVITAFAVVPTVAAAGNDAQVRPQVTSQVVGAQIAKVQRAQVQRAQAAVSLQRHLVQVAHAQRFSLLSRTYMR
jgi:hypothetical protein